MRSIKFSLAGLCIIFLLIPILAQDGLKGADEIEAAIEAKDFKQAEALLEQQVQYFLKESNTDTLAHYISLAGKIGMENGGPAKAATSIQTLTNRIAAQKPANKTMRQVYIETGEFFGLAGEDKKAYDANTEALKYSTAPLEIAKVENNLGVYAQRMGNAALSKQHHRKALAIRETEKNTESEELYMSYNSMAGLMWYASKNDSATYFFNKALQALSKTKPTDRNKYYRPAIVLNNISALYDADGKTTDAIKAQQDAITNIQQYIAGNDPAPKREDAQSFLFEATDNLAGFYKEIGDYKKAKDLLEYSYYQKQKQLKPGHPGIFISEILLGQLSNSMHNYDEAFGYLEKGLNKLKAAEGDYIFWEADARYALALANESKKNIAAAALSYEKADSLYEASYQGEYSNLYLEFLRNASLFYAKNGDCKKAIAKSKKGYDYITKVQQGTLPVFYQLLNLSEVNFICKNYSEAVAFGKKGLAIVNEKIKSGTSALDSVKMELYKPAAIVMIEKAGYELQQKRDTVYLQKTLTELNVALQLLEKRKFLIDDEESINILIADNNELISFAKKIALELYQLTNNDKYLDQVINLHESGLYNRIRARLDKQKALEFSGLPAAVYEEEKKLKAAIPASLEGDRSNTVLMNAYLTATQKWQQHLDAIRVQYPLYYKMRYESIFKSLPQLQAAIPNATTVVRYFFIDSSLHALVLDKVSKKIIDLDAAGLNEKVNELLPSATNNESNYTAGLYQLYEKLWKPLAADIRTKNIIIIPDGVLYNISFELLTPSPVRTYSEIATGSLLASYSITYHYSLFMTGSNAEVEKEKNNYVAFAPGFSDESKEAYKKLIKDSSRIDMQYMELLPQPYTQSLVKKIQNKFGGDVFLDNGSTQISFKQNAGGNKIVHIGTHAEYNNEKPELSRLIFSKAADSATDNNSLFLYDIYNCNINTDLAVLTACESGKPGYQDGEGMVSLAHAFNYAGSKSILTSLWPVDEASASFITEKFIENLAAKIPAGEALQKAKLNYLQQADGRTKSPAYWAGLVLMGDAGTVTLTPKSNLKILLLFAAAIVTAGAVRYFLKRRKKTA